MQALGLGGATYGEYAFGEKGVFVAQNDISLSLAITCVFASLELFRARTLSKLLIFVVASLGSVGLGTRTGVATPIVIPLIVFAAYGLSSARYAARSAAPRRLLPLGIIVIGLAVAGVIWVSGKVSESDYDTMKWNQIAEGDFPRGYLAIGGIAYIRDKGIVQNLFGEGAFHYEVGVMNKLSELRQPVESDRETRMTEVDPIDLLGGYGWPFFILLSSVFVVAAIRASVQFLRTGDSLYAAIALALWVFLGHSAYAGHAFVTPIVGTPIAAILALSFSYKANWLGPESRLFLPASMPPLPRVAGL